jgi:hypothetical protein
MIFSDIATGSAAEKELCCRIAHARGTIPNEVRLTRCRATPTLNQWREGVGEGQRSHSVCTLPHSVLLSLTIDYYWQASSLEDKRAEGVLVRGMQHRRERHIGRMLEGSPHGIVSLLPRPARRVREGEVKGENARAHARR